ncbi:MAG: NAD-dependent epimerase/dehydratase family protein [Planctomycetia bacterium]|nr:NAD-dependent epimerase/dehydratase family protein [Planctomycetia bacterium]
MIRLVFGCGYLGARAAALWQQRGDTVYAVTRHADRAGEFAARGWQPIVADVLRPELLVNLPTADTVLFAVARGRQQDVSIRDLYVDGLNNVLDALPVATRHMIYISSTGVYAQDDGSWVDESSECVPQRPGGIASLEAEQVLAAHSLGGRGTILRMAGLYGPDRVPRREDLLAGRATAEHSQGWLNLIHIDDAAAAVVAAAATAQPTAPGSAFDRIEPARPRLLNVSDGEPVLRRDYLAEIARCLGISLPQGAAALPESVPAKATGRGTTSKRVSNRRMLAELAVRLQYPSYREGLRAILSEAGN